MLLRVGAKNFYCFKEGFELSLELGASCPSNISKGKPISNLLCVKGANASGKTNALKVLSFLHKFCCNSFNIKPDEEIHIDSFFMNEDPIELYCDFEINQIVYSYELSVTNKEVISEKLSRKTKRLTPIFERQYNKLSNCTKEFNDLNSVKLRSNASIISTANQYEIKTISTIYKFFKSITTNVGRLGKVDFASDYRSTSKYYNDNPDILSDAIKIIKTVDLGIADIKVNDATGEDGNKYHFPIFQHDTNVERDWLVFHNESLGTQTLYLTLPYFIYAIRSGGILVMDEFDTDYHPHILQLLISYFDDEEINIHNAQIIFSTHNTEIMEYMSKYRTVLVNKDSSESYAYRLDEISGDIIRNDRPIIPVYNSGKIGGVPRL